MKDGCQREAGRTTKKRLYEKTFYPAPGEVTLTLPIAELVAKTRGVMEEMAGEIGLILMKECMSEEIRRMAGNRHERGDGCDYVRWGSQAGGVVFGGRKVRIEKPRVRHRETGREAQLSSYGAFRSGAKLGEAVMGKMLIGVSTRDYASSLEALCDGYGIRRSSVSRECVRATGKRLDELMNRDLSSLDLAAIFIDGMLYAGQMMILVLGVDTGGSKHVLGLRLGATENAVVVKELLEGLVERGLSVDQPRLYVLDGAKALTNAVKAMFGDLGVIQRCQVHKLRNVLEHVPDRHQGEAKRRIQEAYAMTDDIAAMKSLETTVRWLKPINPSAARSLEEGMAETLTVVRLNLPGILRKSFSSTNCIENCISGVRRLTRNVKRWRDGAMIERWVGCSLLEVERRFYRVRGYQKMSILKSALDVQCKHNTVDDVYAMVA